MAFSVVYKPLALLEVKEAYEWYAQDHINMHTAFFGAAGTYRPLLSCKPLPLPLCRTIHTPRQSEPVSVCFVLCD